MKVLLNVIIVLLVVGCLGAGGWWFWGQHNQHTVNFRMADVKRGEILQTIAATGTAEPEEVVDVGAQVAGLIDRFGTDPNNPGKPIDYRTMVNEGTLLAHIDDTPYQSDLTSAKAMLAEAQAGVAKAQADMGQMNAKMVQAQHDWDRAQKLGPSDAMAQSDYDMYEANFLTAKANVADQKAAIAVAEAGVTAANAALVKAQTNVAYCTINSPVKGEIIDRRVNVGQTVVSSLSAPSLFLIAKDLTKMQVWASVNEADIGNIFPGQSVKFTVNAYPGREFTGEVGKVRLNATMTQNVVTYTVEINMNNSDGKLLPYMTCNVNFEVAHKTNILTVVNTALRYLPPEELVAPDARDAFEKIMDERNGRTSHAKAAKAGDDSATQPSATTAPAEQAQSARKHDYKHGVVWVAAGDDTVRPVKVLTGITDGIITEIQSDDLHDNDQVVIGEIAADAQDGGTNPFAPKFSRKTGQRNAPAPKK